MSRLLVTIETTQLEEVTIERLREHMPAGTDIATTSVSERERKRPMPGLDEHVLEVAVWDESTLDNAVWGDEGHVALQKNAILIIAGSTLPPADKRTDGQRRQLRDAMIFVAHVKDGRHILITDDARGFANHGRRDKLEALGKTKICKSAEVFAMSTADLAALSAPVPG